VSITVDDIDYSLSHLRPFTCTCAGSGRDGADIVVRVSFKTHVYSKSPEIVSDPHHLFDENGKKRVFCKERYEISLTLPQRCREMISRNFLTWVSSDRNTISNMAILDGPIVDGDHAVMFYYLYPSLSSEVDVELVVKSSYIKSLIATRIKRRFNVVQKIKECYFKQKVVP